MLLSLKSITLDAPLKQTGECLILTELILPRPSIAKKSALKDLRVTKGKASLARAPFYEKGLFKEKVDGPFGLKVSVTRPLKHPERNKFLRQLLATGIEGLGEATALSAVLGDVVEEAADQLADRIADDKPTFIATGGIDLDSETLVSGAVTIDLKLNSSLRLADLPPGPKSREKRKTAAKLYKQGASVGTIIFDLGV